MSTITVKRILAELAVSYGVTDEALRSDSRAEPLTWHRHIGMWLAHELTAHSLLQIARAFGRSDHSTVVHAVQRVNLGRESDDAIRLETDELRHRIACRIDPGAPMELARQLLARPAHDRAASGRQIGLLCGEIARLTDELNLTKLILDDERNKETVHD